MHKVRAVNVVVNRITLINKCNDIFCYLIIMDIPLQY